MTSRISIDHQQLATFCRDHHISRLSFFGSVLRDDFRADSDIDVLVEFQSGQEPGLLALARMERELTQLLGRRVDLRTPEDLSRLFRDQVVAAAEVLYAA